MINQNKNNQSRLHPGSLTGQKITPRLSLNLHTMPQTANTSFKKWLVLGISIFVFMIIIVIIFSSF